MLSFSLVAFGPGGRIWSLSHVLLSLLCLFAQYFVNYAYSPSEFMFMIFRKLFLCLGKHRG
jgi:hypothetical protein